MKKTMIIHTNMITKRLRLFRFNVCLLLFTILIPFMLPAIAFLLIERKKADGFNKISKSFITLYQIGQITCYKSNNLLHSAHFSLLLTHLFQSSRTRPFILLIRIHSCSVNLRLSGFRNWLWYKKHHNEPNGK